MGASARKAEAMMLEGVKLQTRTSETLAQGDVVLPVKPFKGWMFYRDGFLWRGKRKIKPKAGVEYVLVGAWALGYRKMKEKSLLFGVRRNPLC